MVVVGVVGVAALVRDGWERSTVVVVLAKIGGT
jgi:hypothetical protein